VVRIKVSLPIVKCLCLFLLILVLKGHVLIYRVIEKSLCTPLLFVIVRFTETFWSPCTFLYINHPWLKLTACFFFLAIVFTKQSWYCRQKFYNYALSFLCMASCHNCTKLHMCIWLWCVAKDCPWLSNSTQTVILILLHSMTEHVLGLCWWGCKACDLLWSWGSMIQSLYLF